MTRSSISRKDFFKLAGGALGIGALSYLLGLRDRPGIDPQADLPDYLDAGSAFPVFRGPYLQKDARLAAFLLPANLENLTSLCDQTLNRVPASPFTYLPLTSSLLMLYAEMQVSSLDERDSQVGLIPETETGFWLLTVAMRRTTLGLVPDHLAWFIPYLLVDEANSIATGREVYGFNKQQAAISRPPEIHLPQFHLDVLGFRRFGPDSLARAERLLTVTPQSAGAAPNQWNDWPAARKGLAASLLPQTRTDFGEGLLNFASQALLQNIPLVFLKQFRDAARPEKACYQRILEAPLNVESFYGGGFFEQAFSVNLVSLASHPLTAALGLPEQQIAAAAAWLNVDFTLGLGRDPIDG